MCNGAKMGAFTRLHTAIRVLIIHGRGGGGRGKHFRWIRSMGDVMASMGSRSVLFISFAKLKIFKKHVALKHQDGEGS